MAQEGQLPPLRFEKIQLTGMEEEQEDDPRTKIIKANLRVGMSADRIWASQGNRLLFQQACEHLWTKIHNPQLTGQVHLVHTVQINSEISEKYRETARVSQPHLNQQGANFPNPWYNINSLEEIELQMRVNNTRYLWEPDTKPPAIPQTTTKQFGLRPPFGPFNKILKNKLLLKKNTSSTSLPSVNNSVSNKQFSDRLAELNQLSLVSRKLMEIRIKNNQEFKPCDNDLEMPFDDGSAEKHIPPIGFELKIAKSSQGSEIYNKNDDTDFQYCSHYRVLPDQTKCQFDDNDDNLSDDKPLYRDIVVKQEHEHETE